MLDRIKGGIFGVAVGDALGVTTEFLDPMQIKRLYGLHSEIKGGGVFGFAEGEVSDDTEMTIAVAKGILENPIDPYRSIGRHFLAWKDTHPKDVGNIISEVFNQYNGDWLYAAERAHKSLFGRSAGNGSLMRVIPVPLAYKNLSDATKVAYIQSKMTHYDNMASDACVIYTKIAHHLLNGKDLYHSIKQEVEGTPYESILYGEPKSVPDGFVLNSLGWSLYFLLTTTSFKEVIVTCANAGYDTDTTAAITGGLAGIYYGFDKIPPSYIEKLLKKDELEKIAIDLYNLRQK